MPRKRKGRVNTQGVDPFAEASAAFLRGLLGGGRHVYVATLHVDLSAASTVKRPKRIDNKANTFRSYIRSANPVQPPAADAWRLGVVLRIDGAEWCCGPIMLWGTCRFAEFTDLFIRLVPFMEAGGALELLGACRSIALGKVPDFRLTGTPAFIADHIRAGGFHSQQPRHWSIAAAEAAAIHHADGLDVQRKMLLVALSDIANRPVRLADRQLRLPL